MDSANEEEKMGIDKAVAKEGFSLTVSCRAGTPGSRKSDEADGTGGAERT